MSRLLEEALSKCNLIITIGGIEPTRDDMMKEVVCQILGDELVMNDVWLNYPHERYEQLGGKQPQACTATVKISAPVQ